MANKVEYKIVDIPFISQKSLLQKKHRDVGCGTTSLTMALSYVLGRDISPDKVFMECAEIDGYLKGVGWKHMCLVIIASKYGVNAYPQRFEIEGGEDNTIWGVQKIAKSIYADKNPVIVSIPNMKNTSSHLVLVVGVVMEGRDIKEVIIQDPELDDESEGKRNIDISDFYKKWNKTAIFIEKN